MYIFALFCSQEKHCHSDGLAALLDTAKLIFKNQQVSMGNMGPATETRVSNGLPDVVIYATGHSPDAKAVLHSKRPVVFSTHDEDRLRMSVGWTTSFPSVRHPRRLSTSRPSKTPTSTELTLPI